MLPIPHEHFNTQNHDDPKDYIPWSLYHPPRTKLSTHSVILLIVGLILTIIVPNFACPRRSMPPMCMCKERSRGNDVGCNGARKDDVKDAIQALLQTDRTTLYLRINGTKMGIFPDFFFDGLPVENLEAKFCDLNEISDSAFFGLSKTLMTLDLSENFLTRVPARSLEKLSTLEVLRLNYNKIESLDSGDFRGLTSLRELFLYGNQIKSIDSNAFIDTGGNITRINLGHNQLSSLSSTSFIQLTNLRTLEIGENHIELITDSTFYGLQSLRVLDQLDLISNSLQELPGFSFTLLSAISSLKLDNNNISNIHPQAFSGLDDTLVYLYLGENKLTEIPNKALYNLTRLRELDLRGNNITTITRTSFEKYGSSLQFLILRNNRLKTIEFGAFDHLTSIKWFWMDHNQLKTLSYQTFRPIMNTFELLDVHDNPFHCSCQLKWFSDWLSESGPVTKVNMPQKTECSLDTNMAKIPIANLSSRIIDCVNEANGNFQNSSNYFRMILLLIIALFLI
ncbi:uncharacterized protein LOC141850283 [Brevipalpus obovatus]|uniref:uncharacterized protein LOC141850283 n=1 Tax=Brevipalpus obovatus TaxID=246614 RepID=UPI003D9EA155